MISKRKLVEMKHVLEHVKQEEPDCRRFELAQYWLQLIADVERIEGRSIDDIPETECYRKCHSVLGERVLDELESSFSASNSLILTMIYESSHVLYAKEFQDYST